jgi:hypothetical protein
VVRQVLKLEPTSNSNDNSDDDDDEIDFVEGMLLGNDYTVYHV